MKPLKFGFADRAYRLAGWLLPVMSVLLFSCIKSEVPAPSPATDMVTVANVLEGEVFTGAIEVFQEDDGVVFSFNNGKTLIALQKLKPDNLPSSGNIEHAEIICSEKGIVLRNASTNEIWTYVNNDPVSIKQFGKIGTYFTKTPNQSLIHSHIRINNLLS
jgi:hypothetical protein